MEREREGVGREETKWEGEGRGEREGGREVERERQRGGGKKSIRSREKNRKHVQTILLYILFSVLHYIILHGKSPD
jgi:hypothetical protein